MVKRRRCPRIGDMTVITGVATGNMTGGLAGGCRTVVTAGTTAGYRTMIKPHQRLPVPIRMAIFTHRRGINMAGRLLVCPQQTGAIMAKRTCFWSPFKYAPHVTAGTLCIPVRPFQRKAGRKMIEIHITVGCMTVNRTQQRQQRNQHRNQGNPDQQVWHAREKSVSVHDITHAGLLVM